MYVWSADQNYIQQRKSEMNGYKLWVMSKNPLWLQQIAVKFDFFAENGSLCDLFTQSMWYHLGHLSHCIYD